MKRLLLTVLTLLTLAAPAMAVELKGKWGPGYVRPAFPIGGRAWISEMLGLDLGVGFESLSPDVGDTRTAWGVDLGLPIVVKNMDNAVLFLRPGFSYADDGGDDTTDAGKLTQLLVSGTLGAEYYFTPSFSVQAAHGIRYRSLTNKGNVGDNPAFPYEVTDNFIESEAFGISEIGFHYYFGSK